jgi:small-conductance mechanosensitive channel
MTIHFGAIVVAAVVAFVLGFLFHGPIAGKLWMKLANIHPTGKEKMSDMYGKMFWNFVANLVTAFVMALIFSLVFTSTLMGPATALRETV